MSKWLGIHKDFKCQNVPVLSNCIHKKHYSVKIGSISFFSSADMQKYYHLLGFHIIGINSSLNIFSKFFAFSKFNILDKKTVLIRLKIKKICLTKKLY